MTVQGKVTSATGDSLTVAKGSESMTFTVDGTTKIIGKGLTTKTNEKAAEGKKMTLSDAVGDRRHGDGHLSRHGRDDAREPGQGHAEGSLDQVSPQHGSVDRHSGRGAGVSDPRDAYGALATPLRRRSNTCRRLRSTAGGSDLPSARSHPPTRRGPSAGFDSRTRADCARAGADALPCGMRTLVPVCLGVSRRGNSGTCCTAAPGGSGGHPSERGGDALQRARSLRLRHVARRSPRPRSRSRLLCRRTDRRRARHPHQRTALGRHRNARTLCRLPPGGGVPVGAADVGRAAEGRAGQRRARSRRGTARQHRPRHERSVVAFDRGAGHRRAAPATSSSSPATTRRARRSRPRSPPPRHRIAMASRCSRQTECRRRSRRAGSTGSRRDPGLDRHARVPRSPRRRESRRPVDAARGHMPWAHAHDPREWRAGERRPRRELSSGRIMLQSEGAEIFFRRVELLPL